MAKSKQLGGGIWALIGIGIYLALQKGVSFVASQFAVLTPRINFTNITFNGVQANVIVPIQNNTPASVPVQSLQGVIKYGNQVLSNVNLKQPTTIGANSTVDLTIDFYIDYAIVGGGIINIINSGNYVSNFFFEGQAVVGGLVIPVNQRIPLL